MGKKLPGFSKSRCLARVLVTQWGLGNCFLYKGGGELGKRTSTVSSTDTEDVSVSVQEGVSASVLYR